MMIRWRIYHRPTKAETFRSRRAQRRYGGSLRIESPEISGAVYLTTVEAECHAAAVFAARQRFPLHRRMSVVAEVSWHAMSAFEQSVFLGTFVPPAEVEHTDEGRKSVCEKCGGTIISTLPDGATRWGRPPKFHDECAPARVKLDRARRGSPMVPRECTAQVA